MIFCATNLSYLELHFDDFLKKIKKYGFNNIEVSPSLINNKFYLRKNMKYAQKILNDNLIEIKSLQSIFYNYSNKLNNYISSEKLIDHFKKIIIFANYFSIKNISIGSCPSRNFSNNKNILEEFNLKLFDRFLDISSKYNINLCIEPMSIKYKNFFLNNHHEVIKFISIFNNKNLKLLLDTGNLEEEGLNFDDFFLKYNKLIGHIHLSNTNINQINIKQITKYINVLLNNKYNKSVSLEYISNKGLRSNEISKLLNKY